MRMGKKKQPTYRVVAADSRSPRDGRFIELIGRYDPRREPSVVEIDNERAVSWLNRGAQPTPQVRKLLEISGAWASFRVSRGDIHTIAEAPPPRPPAAPQAAPALAEGREIHVVGGGEDEETPTAETAEPAATAETAEPATTAETAEPATAAETAEPATAAGAAVPVVGEDGEEAPSATDEPVEDEETS